MDFSKIHRRAEEKALELSTLFNSLQKSIPSASLSLNTLFLSHACESCFFDLARHQEFHNITIPDSHKRAAFVFKWLAKLRPVNVHSFSEVRVAGSAS